MSDIRVGAGYGRVVGLRGSTSELDDVQHLLPFWWRESGEDPEYVLDLWPGAPDSTIRHLEHWVAEHAVGQVFVHAAAVAIDGQVLLLPARSFAGKTTLCVELLRRGATYLSDEYAVLGADGLVQPYPRPLQVRVQDERVSLTAASLGAVTESRPATVGAVASLVFDAHRGWQVEPLSAAEIVLEVLANTVCAQSRPVEALHAVVAACAGAAGLKGRRGPAAEAADPLFEILRS